MPKLVDHEQRRDEIAAALLRVIRRDGVAGASVRTVAAESGWSAGATRHYFSTSHELLAFAMKALMARARQRVEAAGAAIVDVDGVIDFVEELIPLDRERGEEAEVWLALAAAARTDAELSEVVIDSHRAIGSACRSAVRAIAELTGAGLDERVESDRLHALVDGLAVQLTLPGRVLSRPRARAALRAHLQLLAERLPVQP